MKIIRNFHYLTQDLETWSHFELANKACRAGVRWVQLRVKGKSFKEWKLIGREIKMICKLYRAKLIVNDNLEIAYEVKADGVHLGLKDVPVTEARRILGSDYIIGGTANTADDVELQMGRGADYIGIGPFRYTKTKSHLAPELGLEGIRRLVKEFPSVPLIAIGGIMLDDIDSIRKTGVSGIAVSSAINRTRDPEKSAKAFNDACTEWTMRENKIEPEREIERKKQ